MKIGKQHDTVLCVTHYPEEGNYYFRMAFDVSTVLDEILAYFIALQFIA